MSIECKAVLRTSFVSLLLLFAEGMLIFPCYPVTLWLKSTLASVDLISLVAAALALIRLLAKLHIEGWLSLMGSDRNFITSLKAELMSYSFGPRLEGKFTKQMSGFNKRQED